MINILMSISIGLASLCVFILSFLFEKEHKDSKNLPRSQKISVLNKLNLNYISRRWQRRLMLIGIIGMAISYTLIDIELKK